MSLRVLATGVELRPPTLLSPDEARRGADRGSEVLVEAQAFVEVTDDGPTERLLGTVVGLRPVPTNADPTRALLDFARERQHDGLGELLGDLRRAGADITRFEVHAAPFRIELSDDLRAALVEAWGERPPR